MRSWLPLVAIGVIGLAGSFAVLRPRPTRFEVTPRRGDDTLVVNDVHATRLSLSVMDQYGRRLASDTAVRYQRIGGDSIAVAPSGEVRCQQRSDAMVRAVFEKLSGEFVLRCRPVASIDAPSWIDFVVGDTARDLPFAALAPDGRVVTELRGVLRVEDSSIAILRGTTILPRRSGQTTAIVRIGSARAMIGIIVYQPVTSFVDGPPNQTLLGMHVTLARGDTIEVPLPKAAFWATYFSRDRGAAPPTIKLRGDGSCATGDGLNVLRVEEGDYTKYCRAGNGTRMMIAHGTTGADTVRGTVALRLLW